MKKPLQRLPDWPARLAAYLLERHRTPFAWGTHDCCQFARAAARAITGRDIARGLGLRRYTSAQGALRQLVRLGGIDHLPARAGLAEVPLTYAQRGDLVLGAVGPRQELALGVVIGDKAAFAAPQGLEHRPVLECVRSWRI
jgi:hypothetical protein